MVPATLEAGAGIRTSHHNPVHVARELPVQPKKTVQQREKELQSLLANPAGRQELQELESRYYAASGRSRPVRRSVITYILVHEREKGLIGG
jgi:hypothetical protein